MTPSELSLVGLALILWGCSIALFMKRWEKIRMLLPYHPDYRLEKNLSAQWNSANAPPANSNLNALQVNHF